MFLSVIFDPRRECSRAAIDFLLGGLMCDQHRVLPASTDPAEFLITDSCLFDHFGVCRRTPD